MRTAQRDQTGYVTFTGRFDGGAASGSGIAGTVPFTFTRAATGDYTVNWDSALMGVEMLAGCNTGGAATVNSLGAGAARLLTFNPTGAQANSVVYFTVTARRTN